VAQRSDTDAIDYRREGGIESLVTFTPPAELSQFLIDATRKIGLEFAGWDFKLDADGKYWCLEVNPMPGYSPYDERCDGAISRALYDHLGATEA
jgi:glutathione synthase/RimK-type ligase-like ATP-grasp enzyme